MAKKDCTCYYPDCHRRTFTKTAMESHDQQKHGKILALKTAKTCNECGTVIATLPKLVEHKEEFHAKEQEKEELHAAE